MKHLVVVASALLACAGCDALFGLDGVKPIDAKIVDLPVACATPVVPGTQCRNLTLPLVNDTYLSADTPDTALGSRDAIKISADEPALFKFDTSAIVAGEQITALTLTLDPDWSINAKACSPDGTACQRCLTPSIGAWKIHWAVTGWNEVETTWNLADPPTTSWAMPGAAAIPQDRSDVIASNLGPTSGGSMVMDIPRDNLLMHPPTCYRNADRLAVLVTIEGVSYFASHESNSCGNQGVPAAVTVEVCQ